VPFDPDPDFVQSDPLFGVFQFTVDEVQSVLLKLDVSKGAGPDNTLPFILKNCESAFARPLSLNFNRSLSTCFFPEFNWRRMAGKAFDRVCQQR
jgi:hypothetical protein